jgi:hypothetical protein
MPAIVTLTARRREVGMDDVEVRLALLRIDAAQLVAAVGAARRDVAVVAPHAARNRRAAGSTTRPRIVVPGRNRKF